MAKYSKSGKPILRNCRNCEYHDYSMWHHCYCKVKHNPVDHGRLRALFCRFFKISENKLNE